MNNYRPQYHFTPQSGWMNDPNGLIYFNGEYHMFYQALWPRHWGHAVSTDLVHWTYLPIALEPDDLGGIWSGSAVADTEDTSGFFNGGGGLVAVFTHEKDGKQSQSIAYSNDNGRTWIKYGRNPVIASVESLPDFRDPKVFWHAPTNRWVMVLATGDCASFYTSPNLKDWTFASQFGKGHGLPDLVWECPDLFPLPIDSDPSQVKWVLNVSYYGRKISSVPFPECSMQYFIGEFDGLTFRSDNPPDTVMLSTGGIDDYAAVTWANVPKSDGRLIWIGWMSQWHYADKVPTEGWLGAMTVPREVSLKCVNGQPRLVQTLIKELEQLRGAPVSADVAGRRIAPEQAIGLGTLPNAFEVIVEIEPGAAQEVGLRLWHGAETSPSAGGGPTTTIGCNLLKAAVFIDRTQTGGPAVTEDFPLRRDAEIPVSERVKLHVFVDSCSVEVFANDGAVYLASLIFPESAQSHVEIYARGGAASVISAVLFPLSARTQDDMA